ncbi:MAG: PqqD family protein [Erythrobacter sp.]|uniref:PqqD family protein n=1 Tax=Erythrobacter sp. TaxID=1042 RepID=UPI0025CD4889|nr:PqqD family protein [Erythrobacter sp.]MCL9998916.1 PqqD family protein [Erythrobacter sp.]
MPDLLQTHWRISDQAVANAVGEETVILHLGNGTYFGLDPIGTRLWQALQAGDLPGSICESLLATHDVASAQLEADLRDLLGELAANDLIAPAALHGTPDAPQE